MKLPVEWSSIVTISIKCWFCLRRIWGRKLVRGRLCVCVQLLPGRVESHVHQGIPRQVLRPSPQQGHDGGSQGGNSFAHETERLKRKYVNRETFFSFLLLQRSDDAIQFLIDYITRVKEQEKSRSSSPQESGAGPSSSSASASNPSDSKNWKTKQKNSASETNHWPQEEKRSNI